MGRGRECFTAPIYEAVANGTVYGYTDNSQTCGQVILIERIDQYVTFFPFFGSLKMISINSRS